MKPESKNIFLGISASVGLHVLIAAALLFGVSGYLAAPGNPGKIDLMWVSLAVKDKISTPAAGKDSGREIPVVPKTAPGTPQSGMKSISSEIGAPAAGPVADSMERSMPAPGVKTVAYAAAGGHSSVSDAGRQAAGAGTVPVFASAYPLYKENPPPGYPALARQQGYEGVVLVAAEILADGSVGKTLISKSSGYAILDQSAVRAVRGWKFEPARKSGVPCKTWAELPIKFLLNDHRS